MMIKMLLMIGLYGFVFFLLLSISSNFGAIFITSLICLLLAISYLIRYKNVGIGTELAYWGLAYIGFGLALLGIALVQSHAGCWSLLGDCYQHRLPHWLANFKDFHYITLMMLNLSAFVVAVTNITRG